MTTSPAARRVTASPTFPDGDVLAICFNDQKKLLRPASISAIMGGNG